MNLTVYTVGRDIYIETEERRTCIKHHIPKQNKYFKEELRRFRKEIREWLTGATVDQIDFQFYTNMTFHHKALYQAILSACFHSGGLTLVRVELEEEEVSDGNSSEHELQI